MSRVPHVMVQKPEDICISDELIHHHMLCRADSQRKQCNASQLSLAGSSDFEVVGVIAKDGGGKIGRFPK